MNIQPLRQHFYELNKKTRESYMWDPEELDLLEEISNEHENSKSYGLAKAVQLIRLP
jgi:hypothetical protein